ncbi:hypothetical protein AB0G02_41970, partial [Actinosynnema sp. NPDC023658]|uniref:hypothetical protein n=1 Tax=Actinosynnema sp. NPDC023658 TaxID=3155465 RepID=UPI0033C13A0B
MDENFSSMLRMLNSRMPVRDAADDGPQPPAVPHQDGPHGDGQHQDGQHDGTHDDGRHEPFPLTDIQYAYVIGRQGGQGVARDRSAGVVVVG